MSVVFRALVLLIFCAPAPTAHAGQNNMPELFGKLFEGFLKEAERGQAHDDDRRGLEMFQQFFHEFARGMPRSRNARGRAMQDMVFGIIGSSISNILNDQEREMHFFTIQKSLSTDRDLSWRNRDTGARGRAEVAGVEYRNGQECLRYWSEVTKHGRTFRDHVTACPDENGVFVPV